MAVSKRTRYEVLRRDNHTCRYCGGTAPDVKLTVDHVTPTALGGTDDPSNLVAACADCNAGKGSSSPDSSLVADVAQDALRWRAAMSQAVEILDEQRALLDTYVETFDEAWSAWSYGPDRRPLPRPTDWQQSILQFARAGLPLADLEEAVTITCNSRVTSDHAWRYMCGVCWKKIQQLQAIARDILAAEGNA